MLRAPPKLVVSALVFACNLGTQRARSSTARSLRRAHMTAASAIPEFCRRPPLARTWMRGSSTRVFLPTSTGGSASAASSQPTGPGRASCAGRVPPLRLRSPTCAVRRLGLTRLGDSSTRIGAHRNSYRQVTCGVGSGLDHGWGTSTTANALHRQPDRTCAAT